jgi:hypothetical protein
MILGTTDQKLWMFEVLEEVWVGQACARANEKGLTTCAQKGGWSFKKRSQCTKNGATPDCWRATRGR